MSLLHLAAYHGLFDIVMNLKLKVLYECKDSIGQTPLLYAAVGGSLPVVQYLITVGHCNPATLELDNDNTTLLHCACAVGHMNMIIYLITELQCDPTVRNNNGSLPLHFACIAGHLNLAKFFITEQNCDPTSQDKGGRTLLHYASLGGHMNIIEYLITEQNCDPTSQDKDGNTLLHYASLGGHITIVEYLVTELKMDPTYPNYNRDSPLHFACLRGHLNLTKYLINNQNCDPTILNNDLQSPLHHACRNNHMDIIQYIIRSRTCDNLFNSDFWLQVSLYLNQPKKLEPMTTISRLFSSGQFSIEELYGALTIIKNEFPIHSYNKVILTGNSAAGKTTLTGVITERAATRFSRLKFGNVQQVELNTTGIYPSHVKSREVGNLVLYDLAGHSEYHTSHYAVMETVMKQSPATFINIVDLSKPDTEIMHQLSYWLNFIDNATSTMSTKSYLIIIGSHADLLSDELLEKRSELVNQLVKEWANQEFIGFVSMDCRKIDCRDTRKFTKLLYESQQVISAKEPSMSFTCHFLYAVLQWGWKCGGKIAWKLRKFVTFLDKHHSSRIIPSEISLLNDLLLSLSSKGVIMYLQNHKKLAKSWIVVDTETLLNNIIGKLLTPSGL